MSEPCSVCGTDLKKPYKHTRIKSVSSMEWKDYNKKNPKVKHTDRPGTIITYLVLMMLLLQRMYDRRRGVEWNLFF